MSKVAQKRLREAIGRSCSLLMMVVWLGLVLCQLHFGQAEASTTGAPSSGVMASANGGSKAQVVATNRLTAVGLVGTLCLIALECLNARKIGQGRMTSAVLVWTAGVAIGVSCIYGVSHSSLFLTTSEFNPNLKYLVNLAKGEGSGEHPRNIVVIEGGSQAARSVSYLQLQQELQNKGYRAAILPFTIPGANHFERYWYIQKFFELTGRAWLTGSPKPNVLLLREVSDGYDRDPTHQLEQNLYSDRTLSYLQPSVALMAVEALYLNSASSGLTNSKLDPVLVEEVCKHGSINMFNIGLLDRLEVYRSLRSSQPLFLLDTPSPGFHYDGFDRMRQALKNLSHGGTSIDWKAKIIDPPLLQLVGTNSKVAFFVPPTLTGDNFLQEREYRLSDPSVPVFSFSRAPQTAEAFAGADKWYDAGHLGKRGAELFTHWLAEQLEASGLLKK